MRYYLFRKLMDALTDDFEIVDADMKNYSQEIEISAESPEASIRLVVQLSEPES